jgi:hypothetical protein
MQPGVSAALSEHKQQSTGQQVRAPSVNSSPLDKMLKVVVTVLQHQVEPTEVCISIGNSEILLASVYKSQAGPGVLLISLSSQTLDVSLFGR